MRLAMALSVLAFVAAVAAACYLYDRGERMKRAWYATRLDPAGLASLKTQRETMVPGAVIVFGDSRAEDWPRPGALPPEVRWVNAGVGGQTTGQAMLRFGWDASPFQPRVVIIQAGINDLASIAVLPQERARIVRDCVGNLRRMVAEAHAANVEVVLCTVFGRGAGGSAAAGATVDAALAEVNAAIRGMAEPGVHVLDAHAILDEHGRVAPRYQRDQYHLNARGYDALNAHLVRMLRAPSRPAAGEEPATRAARTIVAPP